MGKGFLWERFVENADLPMESVPGLPIIEIAGDRRVLIENHMGVKEYGGELIRVRVRYGDVCICGAGLELLCVRREQLVIRGRIDGISLRRRL